jgi:hypothetical protein
VLERKFLFNQKFEQIGTAPISIIQTTTDHFDHFDHNT